MRDEKIYAQTLAMFGSDTVIMAWRERPALVDLDAASWDALVELCKTVSESDDMGAVTDGLDERMRRSLVLVLLDEDYLVDVAAAAAGIVEAS